MTEKELLYVEDAICHEDSVIAYLNDMVNGLEDESLVSFVKKETKKHQSKMAKASSTLPALIFLLGLIACN